MMSPHTSRRVARLILGLATASSSLAIATAAFATDVTNPAQNPAPVTITIDGQVYHDGLDTLPGYDDYACTPIPDVQYDFGTNQIHYYDNNGNLLATTHWTEWARISSYQTWLKQHQTTTPPSATPTTSASAPGKKPSTGGGSHTNPSTTATTHTSGTSTKGTTSSSVAASATASAKPTPSATPSASASAVAVVSGGTQQPSTSPNASAAAVPVLTAQSRESSRVNGIFSGAGDTHLGGLAILGVLVGVGIVTLLGHTVRRNVTARQGSNGVQS